MCNKNRIINLKTTTSPPAPLLKERGARVEPEIYK
jgi:hypothetical protein